MLSQAPRLLSPLRLDPSFPTQEVQFSHNGLGSKTTAIGRHPAVVAAPNRGPPASYAYLGLAAACLCLTFLCGVFIATIPGIFESDLISLEVDADTAWVDEAVENWMAARRLAVDPDSRPRHPATAAYVRDYLTKPYWAFTSSFMGNAEASAVYTNPCCNFLKNGTAGSHSASPCVSGRWTPAQAATGYEYRRIFKGGNNQVCGHLNSKPVGKPPNAGRSFTLIRDPLSHFLSAYSEIVFRNEHLVATAHKPRRPHPFLQLADPRAKAIAFIRGFLECTLGDQGATTLEHALPQTAFLVGASVDDFYHVESTDRLLNISKKVRSRSHPETNAASGNKHRLAMEAVLREERFMCAVARMVAHDFACFGFPFPSACGDLPVRCPPLGISSHHPINWMDHALEQP
eukprot:m.21759 g.21759  ORF g.21759 m.21759 type:complete len:402 (-) comp5728_c0_seq1:43-1248(-)